MSGVDVLAVLRKASRSVSNEDYVAFDDAFAAVAELIEVMRCMVKADDEAISKLTRLGRKPEQYDPAVILTERGRSALARVTGAQA